ncbi:MAG: hypothetical protein KDD66_04850 [Bdellovibrionales bacterium]|nr:hypothetical protein [Bdellovibrionales bacterium]
MLPSITTTALLSALAEQIRLGRVQQTQPDGYARLINAQLFPEEGIALPCGRKLQVTANIAAHWSTTRFPFLGGVRVLHISTPEQAQAEAMGLAAAMTRKNIWLALVLSNYLQLLRSLTHDGPVGSIDQVLSQLTQVSLKGVPAQYRRGGVKATLLFSLDPRTLPVEVRALVFMALGRVAGLYLPQGAGQLSVDAGCSPDDMVAAALGCSGRIDRPFAGFGPVQGGHGDPSPVTAEATLLGLNAVSPILFGQGKSLSGLNVALEGAVGKVGTAIASELLGAYGVGHLFVSDVDEARLEQRFGSMSDRVTIVPPKDDALYLDTPWDVAIPASGRFQQFGVNLATKLASANEERRTRLLAGPQNCMFFPPEVERSTEILHRAGIVTLDDAALSGGGVACVAGEGYYNTPPLSRREQQENRPVLSAAISDGFAMLIDIARQLQMPPTALFHAITDRARAVLDVGDDVFSTSSPASSPA